MGEPTCVMHAFSYTPGISNEAKEENPMYAMEESVSLGRFMSESLSWEKWSTFSRNRHVEEAEMYSRPGSVKQKKAYFEAHFKRMAALKAAALLEQANASQGGAPGEPNAKVEVHSDEITNGHAGLHDQQLVLSSQPSVNGWQGVEEEADNSGFVANCDEYNPNVAQGGAPDEQNAEAEVHNDGSNINDHADLHDQQLLLSSLPSINIQQEVEYSGFVADNNQHNPTDGEDHLSTKIIQEKDQAAQVESTERLMDVLKQNPSTEMETGLAKTEESRLQRSSLSQDIFVASSPKTKRNPPLSAYIPSSPMSRRNPTLSSYMPSIEAARSVAKPLAVHPGKENTCTPVGRKSWVDDQDKKRTPLRMSINRELNRLISPVIKKIGSSSKASNKDCSTPLKTPAKASVNVTTNAPPETSPQSQRRRARALFDSSACGSKAARPRWQFLSEEEAKSPATGRNKTSSPVIPKAFCLSGDRALRRKENLEEKLNAKATKNLQQQSKLKFLQEKPKERAKLRQSFCFGAKLSSDSFRERDRLEVPSPTEKSKVTDEELPKKGRSRLQNMTFLPPRRPVLKGTNQDRQAKEG